MTTEEYIRDPRFKAFGVCIHEYGTDKRTMWYSHNELPRIFSTYDWRETAVLCQNSMFDCGILSFIYDVHPCFIFDTLSMARAVRGTAERNGLAMMAKAYDLPDKGKALNSTDGLEELTPVIEKELAEYCQHDVFLCEEIFKRLVVGFPSKELRLIDMTIKMFTEPRLVLDTAMLEIAEESELDNLKQALAKAGVDEAELASNAMFADILRSYGIEPPMKISKQTGKPALALAKNDAHFQQLLNGDNEEVALLCDARVNVKSTQARTRARRFLGIASRGALPIPLNYFATETGRYGGTQQVNMQNMKRGGFLRKSIMAPDGYVVGVGDLSQIEPRVIAWLADYDELLSIFCAGGDPYATFGEQMFNRPGMTKESDPLLRQSAKSALLGCSYGLGFSNFAMQLLVGFLGAPPLRYTLTDAKSLGVTAAMAERFTDYAENMKRVAAIPHVCTDRELLIHSIAAKAIIDKYRSAASPVVDFWELLVSRIEPSLIGGEEYNHKDVLLFRKNEIVMASGLSLKYHNMRKVKVPEEGVQYQYDVGNKVEKLYGGRMANHVTQGTARIVMTDAMLRVQKRYPVVGTVHDELLALIPEQEAEEGLAWVLAQMTMEPKWLPGIPLSADGGYAKRYGEAKK
jgi:DNA polymerase